MNKLPNGWPIGGLIRAASPKFGTSPAVERPLWLSELSWNRIVYGAFLMSHADQLIEIATELAVDAKDGGGPPGPIQPVAVRPPGPVRADRRFLSPFQPASSGLAGVLSPFSRRFCRFCFNRTSAATWRRTCPGVHPKLRSPLAISWTLTVSLLLTSTGARLRSLDLELQDNCHYAKSSSNAFASFRSRVSNPSVNQP
jgi:hypothetical protein